MNIGQNASILKMNIVEFVSTEISASVIKNTLLYHPNSISLSVTHIWEFNPPLIESDNLRSDLACGNIVSAHKVMNKSYGLSIHVYQRSLMKF